MKVREVFPDQPIQPVDYSDLSSITSRMMTLANELNSIAANVAQARGIKEFDSDRRKRALALRVREFIVTGDSSAAAETKGRASVGYGEDLDRLQLELTAAEKCLTEYETKKIQFEAARSALSSLKTIAGNTLT